MSSLPARSSGRKRRGRRFPRQDDIVRSADNDAFCRMVPGENVSERRELYGVPLLQGAARPGIQGHERLTHGPVWCKDVRSTGPRSGTGSRSRSRAFDEMPSGMMVSR